MKKGVIFFLSLTLLGCGDKKKTKIVEESPDTNTNETVQEKKPTKVDPNAINPFVNGILDVEQLDQDIDMSMDISQLSLSDIRVLRNSYAAKKGYCFMKADLRGVFGTTSWYNDRMHEKYWNDEEGTAITPILYTPEEIIIFNYFMYMNKTIISSFLIL